MIFSTIVSLRNRFYDSQKNVRTSKIPVISIGNISSGGTGKTPTCIYIANTLRLKGFQPICIGRNIHPQSKGTIFSDYQNPLEADTIGDELCLIQNKCSIPILSTSSKSKAAFEYEDFFLNNLSNPVFIIDDGFQHRSIARNIDIVLVDDETINGKLLPFGRNREPIYSLKRASIVLNFCKNFSNEYFIDFCSNVFTARKEYSEPYFIQDVGRNFEKEIYVLSSIAKPNKFRAELDLMGYVIKGYKDFPDHHLYSDTDIKKIAEDFQFSHASYFVTTEKDMVKLKKYSDFCNSFPILVYPQIVIIKEEASFFNQILHSINP